ncbi:MAG: hypothetical protein JJE39_16350 [Vicinamibacteria bacterium]|nr:hypothetical protein [Vicinamibacteria bacterium]
MSSMVATLALSGALMVAIAHFTWDVLQSADLDLFHRVNAINLESEVGDALQDPISTASIVLFSLVVFGLPSALGACLSPRRWWAPAGLLLAIGTVLWLRRFAPLFLMPGSTWAKASSAVALFCMFVWAIVGAHLGRLGRNNHHAG